MEQRALTEEDLMETFKKRQKAWARKEKQQKKAARRMERRNEKAAQKNVDDHQPHAQSDDSHDSTVPAGQH
jgi:hypothetical protein